LEGPTAVSTDFGNVAELGSDSLIFVPQGTGGGGLEEVTIQNSLPSLTTLKLWVNQDEDFSPETFPHASLGALLADDHPQYLNEARAGALYLPLSGGVMQGPLTVLQPVLSVHAARKADVDAVAQRNITAGNGLTGGGALTASRTLNVGAGWGITVGADTVSVNTASTDGRYVEEEEFIRSTGAPSGVPAGGYGTVWVQF
jgi:hypothetical protein